jgi:catechol-2,3-dioxygenase
MIPEEREGKMPQHQGFGHLTLTVTDLERSADFYNRVLGSWASAS